MSFFLAYLVIIENDIISPCMYLSLFIKYNYTMQCHAMPCNAIPPEWSTPIPYRTAPHRTAPLLLS